MLLIDRGVEVHGQLKPINDYKIPVYSAQGCCEQARP